MTDKIEVMERIKQTLVDSGYTIAEENTAKPWGGYYRLDNADAEQFVAQYFPEITIEEARLGNMELELSPKILVVAPNQRLSWQYHYRRAERWHFLTEGSYIRSQTDEQTEQQTAQEGTTVQFSQEERHRLIANDDFTIVAEIWQHTQPDNPSDEEDIVRLDDDYQR